jgi:hypothetical protein
LMWRMANREIFRYGHFYSPFATRHSPHQGA